MTFHEPHLRKLAVFFLFFFCAEIQWAVIYMDLLFNGERVIFILFVTTLSKGSQRTAWYNSVNFQT